MRYSRWTYIYIGQLFGGPGLVAGWLPLGVLVSLWRPVGMHGRTTRRQALEQKRAAANLATTVLSCSDICRLILPALPLLG